MGRVAEGFAFGRAAAGGIEGDHVGTQAFGCHVEGHTRARAGFEEKVDDCLAAQGGEFFDAVGEHLLKGGSGGVDLLNLGETEFFERNEVFAGPEHGKSGNVVETVRFAERKPNQGVRRQTQESGVVVMERCQR